jgi:hypothetical protein
MECSEPGSPSSVPARGLLNLRLESEISFPQHIESVLTDSPRNDQEGGGQPVAIDERENIWEVEILLAR